MKLFDKIKEKFENRKKEPLLTPAKSEKANENVAIYRTTKGNIHIVAKAIDVDSKYIIDFTSEEAFHKLTLSYPRRMYEGYFANFTTVNDERTKNFQVVITFKDIKGIGAHGTPWIKVILTGEDEELALNMYNQLNNQANVMEEAKQNKGLFSK